MNANAVDMAVDSSCDHCSKTTRHLYYFPLSGNRNYLCGRCAVRESGEPACTYCERPTLGDYVRLDTRGGVTIACGPCRDHWREQA